MRVDFVLNPLKVRRVTPRVINLAMVAEDSTFSDPLFDRKAAVKVTIQPCQPKSLTHLPKRPPVDIAFNDLTYIVSEGGTKKSE